MKLEKRDFKRLPAQTEVKIKTIPDGQSKQGQGKDISGGGILLSSDELFEIGTLLELEIMTTTHKTFSRAIPPMRAKVRVVRVEGTKPPYDIAAKFVEVDR
jgi:hypothetical protein